MGGVTLYRGTSFTGLSLGDVRVAGPIKAGHHQTVAKDQAYVYETITGINADGTGGASTNTAHVHESSESALYLPLMYQSFGNQYRSSISNNSCASINTGTETDGVIVARFPIYVPAMHVGNTFDIYIQAYPDPAFELSLETAIGTDAGGACTWDTHFVHVDHPTCDSVDIWRASFSVDTAGVYVIKISTYIYPSGAVRWWKEIGISPRPYPGSSGGWGIPTKRAVNATNTVTVGDAEASNAWMPTHSELSGTNQATGTIQYMNACNDALLQERAFGLPAAGNATATLAGHTHDGTVGAELDLCLGCWTLGPFPVGGLDLGESGSVYDSYTGAGLKPPCVRNTTLLRCMQFTIRTPASALCGADGTSRLHFAFVGYEQPSGKGGSNLAVRITTLCEDSSTTARTYTSAGAADGYILTAPADGWKHTSGGATVVAVDIKETVNNSPTFTAGLCGLCAYLS